MGCPHNYKTVQLLIFFKILQNIIIRKQTLKTSFFSLVQNYLIHTRILFNLILLPKKFISFEVTSKKNWLILMNTFDMLTTICEIGCLAKDLLKKNVFPPSKIGCSSLNTNWSVAIFFKQWKIPCA